MVHDNLDHFLPVSPQYHPIPSQTVKSYPIPSVPFRELLCLCCHRIPSLPWPIPVTQYPAFNTQLPSHPYHPSYPSHPLCYHSIFIITTDQCHVSTLPCPNLTNVLLPTSYIYLHSPPSLPFRLWHNHFYAVSRRTLHYRVIPLADHASESVNS